MVTTSFITVPRSIPFEYGGRSTKVLYHPHKFSTTIQNDDFAAALKWCGEQFGDPYQYERWYCIIRVIFIQDDNDAFAFRMLWC